MKAIEINIINKEQDFLDQRFILNSEIKNEETDVTVIEIPTAAFKAGEFTLNVLEESSVPLLAEYGIISSNEIFLLHHVTLANVFFEEDGQYYGVELNNVQFKVDLENNKVSLSISSGIGRHSLDLTADLDIATGDLTYSSNMSFRLTLLVTDQAEEITETDYVPE